MSYRNNDCRIYIGNLPPDIRTKDIEDLFFKFGKITFIDLKNRRGPPFAFVEFEDPRDAEDAVQARDGYDYDGYRLRVEFPRGNGPGRGMGAPRGRGRGPPARRSQYRVLVSAGDKVPLSFCFKKRSSEADHISSSKKKRMEGTKNFPTCSEVIEPKEQITSVNVSEKLMKDLKTVMLNGKHSDVILKVNGEDFELHKVILTARNSYFESLFQSEKEAKVFSIEDCDIDIFRSFIHFLYTGELDKLSSENVCGLYEAATKFQEEELKNICVEKMLNTFSLDKFFDYIVLALKFNEKVLLQKAIEFFIPKGKEILRNVKWETFEDNYPKEGNKLFLKALQYYAKSFKY